MTDLFGYPHQPGAQDRDTSRAAAAKAAIAAPQLRAKALAVLERSRGLTADEVDWGCRSFPYAPASRSSPVSARSETVATVGAMRAGATRLCGLRSTRPA